MKARISSPTGLLLAGLVLLGAGLGTQAAPVVVSTVEVWNGTNNPHAGDGVQIVAGTGTALDPYVYSIPDGMTITSSGAIQISAVVDRDDPNKDDFSVRFQFLSGNLQIDAGGYIDIARPSRSDDHLFVLDLGGGSVTGAGRIVGLRGPGTERPQKPRKLAIINVNDVTLSEIDVHTENVSGDLEGMEITATGKVTVTGLIYTGDTDTGGNDVNPMTIQAASISVNDIDTRALRNDGQADNGDVILVALSPAGGYTPSGGNAFANRLTVSGAINTKGVGPKRGNVTFQAVQLVLGGASSSVFSLTQAANGTFTAQAGRTDLGTPQSDLFVNAAGVTWTPTFDVEWDGVAPSGAAPTFTADPIYGGQTTPDTPYSFDLAPFATDPNGDPRTFSKGSGPAWLSVAPNGTVSGTPTAANSGTNTFRVAVSDGTRFDIAVFDVNVSGPPKFATDPILKAKGFQDTAYSGTLADVASDPDNDPMTFAKVSGPDWLAVAPNGALSGTPTVNDTFTNSWVVSVTDGTGTNTATLLILVGGAPKFFVSPILKPNAAVGIDYTIAAQTLAVNAADPDGDPLTFTKVSASPAWLTVAANGSLSGTAAAGDVGTNQWTVRVSDATRSADATLQIVVVSAGADIVVSGVEYWDGVQNPHAGEGVGLAGSGTSADPAIYTIPKSMQITSTGRIYMSPTDADDRTIAFTFTSGDLKMDAGAVINIARLTRDGRQYFFLDLGGGSITGAGRIVGLDPSLPDPWNRNGTPRVLTIQNVNDVVMDAIDAHVEGANNSARHMAITANGRVNIGTIDNTDIDPGGNDGSHVTVKAGAITVGNVLTFVMRDAGTDNGRIDLRALKPTAYDPSSSENAFTNKLIVGGLLKSLGNPANERAGDVTLMGVHVQFAPGASLIKPPPATLTFRAGAFPNGVGAGAEDMFWDQTASGLTPAYDVQWSGEFEPLLKLERVGTDVKLSWNGLGFNLQETSDVTNPAGWSNIDNTSPVTRSAIGGPKFYRLKK